MQMDNEQAHGRKDIKESRRNIERMPINTKKYLRFLFTLTITAGIFILLFRRVPFLDVVALVKKVNFKIILLTLGISIGGNILVSANRWKLILKHLGCPISFKESLLIKMGSNSVISILPLRTGEFFRILYLKRLKDIPCPTTFFSVISEYLLNVLVLIFSIFVGGIAYSCRINNFGLISKACILTFLFFAALSLLIRSNLFTHLRKKFFGRFDTNINMYVKELSGVLKNPGIIFHSFLFEGAGLINAFLLAKALGNPFPLDSILIFIPVITLASNIPVTIAGLGIREAATIFFLLKFAPVEILLSFGILYSFVEYLFPMIIGASLTGLFLSRAFFDK